MIERHNEVKNGITLERKESFIELLTVCRTRLTVIYVMFELLQKLVCLAEVRENSSAK